VNKRFRYGLLRQKEWLGYHAVGKKNRVRSDRTPMKACPDHSPGRRPPRRLPSSRHLFSHLTRRSMHPLPASISPDAHCFSYLHSAHRRRSLTALICTDVHRFSTKMSALCTGDDDDDQISSYFLPGKTLSEYLVNRIN
jgi:hypothetical protein